MALSVCCVIKSFSPPLKTSLEMRIFSKSRVSGSLPSFFAASSDPSASTTIASASPLAIMTRDSASPFAKDISVLALDSALTFAAWAWPRFTRAS